MHSKALCLAVLASVALVASGAAIKGRQPDNSAALAPTRFQSPSKTGPRFAPAAPRAPQPLPSRPAALPEFTQQQQQQEQQELPQQQQQQEIDSESAGAQADASLARLPVAPAAPIEAAESEEPRGAAEPYAFNYNYDASDSATSGSSTRDEKMDTSGKVTGFYTLSGEDGRDRRVDYIADASGFRAVISTNEVGTAPKNSADVEWQAQSPSDGQLRAAESATEAARARAAQAPAGLKPLNTNKPSWSTQASASRNSVALAAPSQQQEQYEQIRQAELNSRARKSRNVKVFTV